MSRARSRHWCDQREIKVQRSTGVVMLWCLGSRQRRVAAGARTVIREWEEQPVYARETDVSGVKWSLQKAEGIRVVACSRE